jgi:hypothetical protein
VSRGEGGVICIAACIDENPAAAIRLTELLGQVLRIAPDQQRASGIRKPSHVAVIRASIERYYNVEPFGARRLHLAFEPEFGQQIAKRDCRRTQNFRLWAGAELSQVPAGWSWAKVPMGAMAINAMASRGLT